MTWNYRAIKEIGLGEMVYQVHKCYYDDKGELQGWEERPSYAQGETLQELKADLTAMLDDIGLRPVLDMEELRKRFPKEEAAP